MNVETVVDVAKRLASIVYLLFLFAFVEAMVQQLQEWLHEFRSISFGIQTKLLYLLLAIVVFKQLSSEIFWVKYWPFNLDLW